VFTLLSYFSSVLYLQLAAHRDPRWEDGFARWYNLSITLEILFLLFMVLQFFKAYVPQYESKEIRDYSMIAQRYLSNDFKIDFIAILPLQFLSLPTHNERYFYLLKLVRFKKGFQSLDRQATMKFIKRWFTDRIIQKCKVDQEYANSTHS
jgi:hypothetical protein